MRITLVGADCEENLGLGMIAATLLAAGHRVAVVPYDSWDDVSTVASRVMDSRPEVVGLAIQFQHGAPGFLALAGWLRHLRFAGHITCGGQYPTMTWREILANEASIDSIVMHDGEDTIVDLVCALRTEHSLLNVAGLAVRGHDGMPMRTAPRAFCLQLDTLPFAHRYRAPSRHLGIPFIPISGSRGCWGSCTFCAISTAYRSAREQGVAGPMLRMRSPENIANEMAKLWRREPVPSLFCFHDDTLLLPRPNDSLARLSELRTALNSRGVGRIGLIGKCRPDCVTFELAQQMRDLGVVRMFVGVENGSQRGLDHLNRLTQLKDIENALEAFTSADIFVCYNLLLFEPKCVLADVRENVAFIRRHPGIPVNFCRAEPYNGTPLHRQIGEQGMILGNYLGWDYRIGDDRAELAFRIATAAFRDRNYSMNGIANRIMGLGYTAQLFRNFYDSSSIHAQRVLAQARALIVDVSMDTADLLERAIEIAANADLVEHEQITRETITLGLDVAARDCAWHQRLDELTREFEALAFAQRPGSSSTKFQEKARQTLGRLAVATCVVAGIPACGGETEDPYGDPAGGEETTGTVLGDGGASPAGGRSNMGGYISGDGGAPPAGGRSNMGGYISGDGGAPPAGGRSHMDGGAPPAGGRSNMGGYTSGDGGASPAAGMSSTGGTASFSSATTVATVDNLTMGIPATMVQNGAEGNARSDSSLADPAPAPLPIRSTPRERLGLVGQWRDTGPKRLTRSTDLPLSDPPDIKLDATGDETRVEVSLLTEAHVNVRFQCSGRIEGIGQRIVWYPDSPEDALQVVARSTNGVSFAQVRLRDIVG